jgi:hypothetical protein
MCTVFKFIKAANLFEILRSCSITSTSHIFWRLDFSLLDCCVVHSVLTIFMWLLQPVSQSFPLEWRISYIWMLNQTDCMYSYSKSRCVYKSWEMGVVYSWLFLDFLMWRSSTLIPLPNSFLIVWKLICLYFRSLTFSCGGWGTHEIHALDPHKCCSLCHYFCAHLGCGVQSSITPT